MKFYTSVNKRGNSIYERGYENGKGFSREVRYKPYMFVNTAAETDYRTIHDEPVGKITFETMRDARQYIEQHKDLVGHDIYGITDFEFLYIYDNYPKGFEFEFKDINVINIDIENSMKKYDESHEVKIRKKSS